MKPLLLSIAALLIFGCGKKQEQFKATTENITESVYASGIVKSFNQYQAFPNVSGIITEIPVTEGQVIKKGDVIIRIDNSTAKLNRENAKLAAEFSDAKSNSDKLDELKMSLDLAKSKKENDSLLFTRQQKLHDENIGSQIEYEQRKLAYENSKNACESAIIRYKDMKKQIEYSSTQSKNNLAISSTISDDFNVKSTMDGKVYSILREKGEIVSPQTPVAVIGDDKNFYLELQIDEYDISKVKTGQKIIISMDSYRDKVFEAIVTKINPLMNERSKSFTVEAEFTTRPENLFPNLSVEANIIIQTKKNVITIPNDYLSNDSFVILSNKEKRKVTTGLKDYQKVEILDGLNAGEVILKPE
jgi:HlyD family secretion protein